MYNYSIMPLDAAHVDEICEDIRRQYQQGITSCALFCMTLVPEGDPPIPKAEMMCQIFDRYYEKLHKDQIPCGMLMQASIGHGYALEHMFPFQQFQQLATGNLLPICCPYDEGFREYIRHTMEVMASHHPDLIMVDDDFRMLTGRGGCACPLHLAEFHRRSGTAKTREEIYAHAIGDSEEDEKYRNLFVETQIDSLIGAAMAMREGIDRVDPTLPGAFCCCSHHYTYEGAFEIASILAGKDNPVCIRINNGNYHPAGARYLTSPMRRAAIQIAQLRSRGQVDAILAETDTCPQNRYSTSAHSLHAQFTGTILEGANGAKHWITRLSSFEPSSGAAYRQLLGKNSGFYHALSHIVPTLRWIGCRLPLSTAPKYSFKEVIQYYSWATHVLERLGLPMYFSAQNGITSFLDNCTDQLFSDEQLLEMFKGTVFLDGPAAENLTKRGMSQYMGVTAEPWAGKHISGELLYVNQAVCAAQIEARKLTPIAEGVLEESMAYHLTDGKTKEPLFPGVTVYRNPLGGTTVTFCGKTETNFVYYEAFSFLNESRKLQLINLLRRYGELPLYYPGDAEVYLRAAYMPDDSLFCAFFNLSFDPIEEIQLATDREIQTVEILMPDGNRKNCDFRQEGQALTIQKAAYTLDPVILFLK